MPFRCKLSTVQENLKFQDKKQKKHHLHPPLQLHHPQPHHHLVVDIFHGKATIIAMIRTTMQDVNGMVEIAVVIMSTPTTALSVNA